LSARNIQLEPQIYSPAEYPERCAARKFAEILGIPADTDLCFPAREVNASIGPKELELLNRINRLSTENPAESINGGLLRVRELLAEIKLQDAFTDQVDLQRDRALEDLYEKFYSSSNSLTRRSFFPSRPELFTPEHAVNRSIKDLSEDVLRRISPFSSADKIISVLQELTAKNSAPRT